VAQHRLLTAREHCGQPSALGGQHLVAERVDAAVHPVQPTVRDPPLHGAVAVAALPQLRAGHDAVLTGDEGGDGLGARGWAIL
jgi:hypothetical protein